FISTLPLHPTSSLFPYTTLFRSYYVWRGKQLHLAALYREDGEYRYSNGFSLVALTALIVAILPNLPGFLVTVKLIDASTVSPFLDRKSTRLNSSHSQISYAVFCL